METLRSLQFLLIKPFVIGKLSLGDKFTDASLMGVRDIMMEFYSAKDHVATDAGGKVSLTNFDDNYEQMRRNAAPDVKVLLDQIQSDEFIEKLWKNIRWHGLKNRSDGMRFYFLLPWKLARIFCFTRIQFSWMRKNTFIPPHTDGKSKLVSALLYLPDKTESKEQVMSLGTTFLTSDLSSRESNHLSGDALQKFRQSSSELLTNRFENRNVYFFLRNNRSWHEVKRLDCGDDYIRCSLNINLYGRTIRQIVKAINRRLAWF